MEEEEDRSNVAHGLFYYYDAGVGCRGVLCERVWIQCLELCLLSSQMVLMSLKLWKFFLFVTACTWFARAYTDYRRIFRYVIDKHHVEAQLLLASTAAAVPTQSIPPVHISSKSLSIIIIPFVNHSHSAQRNEKKKKKKIEIVWNFNQIESIKMCSVARDFTMPLHMWVPKERKRHIKINLSFFIILCC